MLGRKGTLPRGALYRSANECQFSVAVQFSVPLGILSGSLCSDSGSSWTADCSSQRRRKPYTVPITLTIALHGDCAVTAEDNVDKRR